MTPQDQLKQLMATLQKNADANARARQESDRNTSLVQIGRYFSAALQPIKEAVEEMKRIGSSLGILSSRLNSLEIPTPEVTVDLSTLRIPEPKITVKPIVDISSIKMPDEMNVKGWVGFMGYDRSFLTNPLPVQLRDASGNPVKLFENLTQAIGGGGAGKHDFFTIKGFSASAYADYVNSDNRLRVSVETGGSGLTDSELRASAVPVSQVSGANWSVFVTGSTGTVAVSIVDGTGVEYDGSNPVPVTIVSGSSAGTEYADGATKATPTGTLAMGDTGEESGNIWALAVGGGVTGSSVLRVVHVTDVATSTNVINTVTVSATDLDIRNLVDASDSVSAYQVSGAIWSVQAHTFAQNPSGVQAAVRMGVGSETSAMRIVHAADAVSSVYVTGSSGTTVTVGPTVADAADDGNAPVQMGGIARTTNPTAVAGGDVVKASMDDIGRQLVRPVQVRDLLATAYASLTNGTETTLATAAAGTYLDLVYVMGTNNSDAAVTVDLRAVSAGNIQTSIRIPANGTAGVSLPVPIPQDETGNAWTADMPDITGTTVTISALFSKEV